MDEKADCPSPKEKGTGFRSFFSRLGGKRPSLPQLQTLEVNNGHTSATLSNQLLSPTKSITPSPLKNSHDAPPLFVAYPQAIKAAALAALTTSSDTILRRNLEQKNREKKCSRLAQRARSYSKVEMEWTQKMFLLVPSMLLQYSGEGAVDRMPEKILQLTATSVAFASDIIPGRPYVLQVSQNANADGSPITEDNKRGKIKLPWKNSTKHVAVSFLLIFDTAKEMDSWMGCIRAEAAKLAGTYIEEEPEQRVSRALSRRISIRRDREEDDIFDTDTSHRFSRYSRNSRASLDAGTSVTTAISSEQVTLNHLRGSRSYMSMSSNGRATVHGTSPETSPERPSGQVGGTRRSGIPGVTSYPRSSIELRSNGPASPRRSIERMPTRAPSPCSPSFYASVRAPVPSPGWKVQLPSPTSPTSKRNSVYSNNSVESTGSRPAVRRSSATCTKLQFRPEFTINQRSHSSTYGRARPTSMVDSRPSLEVPRSTTTLPYSNSLSLSEPRNLQRRSMTALGNKPDYGIGPPAYPPPQIPLPELPPEGYSVLNSRRKSIHQLSTDKRVVNNGSVQALGISSPILGNRHSFQVFRKPGNM